MDPHKLQDIVRHVPVTINTGLGATETTCTLSYWLGDPLAFRMWFEQEDGDMIQWVVGRDLLQVAMAYDWAGNIAAGDVLMIRQADKFHICVRSPEGSAKVTFRLEDVAIFYAATVGACRPGTELVGSDLDAEWQSWNEGGK